MAASHGKLKEFCSETGDIDTYMYLECVELHFSADRIRYDDQLAVFPSIIREKEHLLLHNLVAPKKPNDKTLNEIIVTIMRFTR